MNSEWKVLVADMVGKGRGRGRWMVGVVLWVHIGGVRSSALPRLAIEAESLLGAGYVEYGAYEWSQRLRRNKDSQYKEWVESLLNDEFWGFADCSEARGHRFCALLARNSVSRIRATGISNQAKFYRAASSLCSRPPGCRLKAIEGDERARQALVLATVIVPV